MAVATKTRRNLTLKDRLSHLNFTRAVKLLGSDGARLIQYGGACEINVEEQVYLGEDLFRLTLPDAVVTITLMAETPERLCWNCTSCDTACGHVGAALALILEEKMALGLAAPPPERQPVASLGEEELVRQALVQREERAHKERMRIRPTEADKMWTDYLVSNELSGRTYRVALRGWEAGDSYCSCPDFRKNTLGTCKHILRVQRFARKRFSPAVQRRPYQPSEPAVHLRYGEQLELRLLVPPDLNGEAARIVRPIAGRPIEDVVDLMSRLRRLEALGCPATVYPDAEEFINQRLFQSRIQSKVAEIRRDPARHPLRKELLKVELLPYQLDGIAFVVGAGRAVLADDMGLGKTIQAIGSAELLAREAGIRKVLIVCPASLKSQWRIEIERFCDRSCQLVLGGAKERPAVYANDCFFTICNYEQVQRDLLAIERTVWDYIILDEGQRIKNWETKTSQVIKALRSPFALVLSGTPLENRLDDLFSVVEFIDERRLGPAFRFFNRHRVVDERGKVLGYQKLDDLRARLRPILLRRTRGSVMQQLPPRTTEIVRIAPTQEQLDLHGAHMRVASAVLKKKFISEMDLLRLQRALLMCRMAADSTTLVDKKTPGYSSKLEMLDGLFERLLSEADRKIVLFSEWTTMLDLIERLLKRRGVAYVRLDGSVPQPKRQPLVRQFQNEPSCKLFITTNAGSTGLNLQAANTVINVDLPWNPAVLEQRVARAHRMGQKNPVQVYVLVTEQTIEERLLGTLSSKHELALAALDVESTVDRVDLISGMEELKQRLEVLLGARPVAPVDESERVRQAAEAERLARKERVSTAGGQLLGAAFEFLGALVPPRGDAGNGAAVEQVKQRLSECVERDEQGRLKLTVTLPDAAALDNLARSLAGLLGAA